jgi:hypothetical protein
MYKRDVRATPLTNGFYVSLKRKGAPPTAIVIQALVEPPPVSTLIGAFISRSPCTASFRKQYKEGEKMRLAIVAALVLICAAGNAQPGYKPGKPGSGMTDAKCEATWIAVSPNGDTISKDKLAPYTFDFTTLDTDNDGTIDANEFMAGCKGGLIR